MDTNGFFGDLRVAHVDGHDTDLRVDLYGGDQPTCGSIVLEFATRAERRQHQETVRRWRDSDVLVHLRYSDGDATLTAGLGLLDSR